MSGFLNENNLQGFFTEDEESCLYAKLNKEVEKVTYEGKDTDTANVVIDNVDRTIAVNVHNMPIYTEVDTDGDVTYLINNNVDVTFTSNAITYLTIQIPSDVVHGYTCGFNFSTFNEWVGITVQNLSAIPIQFMLNGSVVDSLSTEMSCNYMGIILCTGQNLFCHLLKVEK